MRKNWHSTAALAALSAFVIGTAAIPAAEQGISFGGTAFAQVQLDQRPAAELSDAELEARIGALRDIIQGGDLSKKDRRALRQMMKADRSELMARRGETASDDSDDDDETEEASSSQQPAPETATPEQPAPETAAPEQPASEATTEQAASDQDNTSQRAARQLVRGAQPASQLSDGDLQNRIAAAEGLAADENVRDRLRQRLRELIDGDRAELQRRRAAAEATQPAETEAAQPSQEAAEEDGASDDERNARRAARQLLRNAQPAADLSDADLRNRIATAEELASDDRVRRRLRRELRALAEGDRAELQGRNQSAQPAEPAEQEQTAQMSPRVREILDDDRRAADLNDRQLRRRLQNIRATLQEVDMPRRQSRLLRERMEIDREELRARVARQEGQEVETADDGRNNDREREILRDRTPPEDLNRRELRDRIQAARNRLDRSDLSAEQRDRLTARLRADRRELRQRRRENRAERRERLREQRRDGEINITIGGDFSIGIGGNAAVAEIDDEELMRQLTAAPTRDVDRRYTAEELEDHTEWRAAAPGIEVDTIQFAFNAYEIGPEEVDELERLGTAIEQILAVHPNEVFVVEGHTDAVGSAAYNQDLSEKRAASVRGALLDYFVIEPENLIPIGYGERYLRIPTEDAERENRRVTLRRATPYLEGASD